MLKTQSSYPISHYWSLQFLFWSGVSVLTFFTLTLWYGQVGWLHAGHTLLQAVMGLLLSIPLHWMFNRIWEVGIVQRVLVSLLAVGIVATLWTVLRVVSFIWITDEQDVWADFGGWYFGAYFIFLCWSGLYHGSRYFQLLQSEYRKMHEAQKTVSAEQLMRLRAEAEAKEAQLKMLRYQLNPHFLFNTLNAINSLVQAQESDRAQRIIVQLSRFLRYSLDNNPEMKISLAHEINALLLYLEIEKTRFADRLTLDFDIDEETNAALVPSLLLQPLVENSMKYAIAKSEQGGTISVRSRIDDHRLILEVSDSGTGKKLNSSKFMSADGRGIGLQNTLDRLQAFYGSAYKFDLTSSSSGGLKTIITIPYEVEAGERSGDLAGAETE
ncbi:MAG: histidine kinase [Arenicella sp.]|nr:histidine kinase [Arenicella sp.]